MVEDVFTPATTKELWSSIYLPALPFTPQQFSVEAILPAMLYLFRWGYRRGLGSFRDTYGIPGSDGKKTAPSIDDVVRKLVKDSTHFVGFTSEVGSAILGDLTLTYCLENVRHSLGRTEQIQRVLPVHYLSSWFDLPDWSSSLRFIPEFLVSILINQDHGEFVLPNDKRSRFSVAKGFEENILLRLFGKNMSISGTLITNLNSDTFIEVGQDNVGIDQLLLVRMAQKLGGAPQKSATRGVDSDKIRNGHGVAAATSESFREDFSVFVQVYGASIPRQAFSQMLESCLSLGLTCIYLSSANALLEWETTGKLPERDSPWPLFVDCSNGSDNRLRSLSEEVVDECQRRLERVPIVTMTMRVLESKVKYDRRLRELLPPLSADPTEHINFLGSLLNESHSQAERVIEALFEKCEQLADALQAEDNQEPAVQNLLRSKESNSSTRLAEALVSLMGNKLQSMSYLKVLDSSLMNGQSGSSGLGQKRRVNRIISGKRKSMDARSIVLTNTMLDYLIHRHLRKAAKGKGRRALTYVELLELLRNRYGLYVDIEPPGMSIPSESLQRNRAFLERRLRDLGLLVGVNDAETMKELRSRFEAEGDHV